MKVIDDLGNTSSLSNVVSGKTKTGPKMNVTPSSIPKMSLNTGQTGSQTLTIQNTGDENLTYDISEVPSASAIGTESIEPDALTNSSEKAAYAPSQILVKFKEGVSEISIRDLAEQMDAHTIRVYPEIGARLIETVAQIDPMELARMYLASGLVDYAEPDYIVQTMAIPNDPSFSSLYGLNNTGQTGGTVDADIDAPEAWDITKGSTSVVVAVIDTGVDYSHQDLSTNIWTNPGEIANNGKDDDGNGYVDDIRGWDFVNKDNDPMDDNKHGTHVSGTIGGVGNNGVGVAGVSWTVKIMPLKFLSGSGSGYTSDAVSAVIYAAKNGAKIMSNSWGGGGYSQALYDAIKLADSKGCLFVAAAGNSSSNNDQVPNYPSNYNVQNVIAVAATDHNDNLASFSSYGVKTVHLGAPGVSIYSTLPNNSYGSLSGTSMATPHVAGACALVWGGNQSWNYLKVKNQILANVDKISSLSDKVISGGRLNVYKAFQGLETIPPADVTNLSSEMVSYSTIKLKWTATGDDGGSGTATSYEIRYSTSVINSSNFSSATLVKGVPAPKPSGSLEELNITSLTQKTKYYFALKAIDDVGNISGLSNVPSATTDEASVVYKDDMESAAGWTATGLWHQSTRKNSSPTHSFYYGSETKGNYDTGAKNSGTLTSSPIDLTSGVSPGLSFQFWRSVENYAYGSYDKTYLEISKDSGKTWNLLWYKDSKNASEQAWTSSGQLDLTSYKGYKVLLRFTFNTVDAYLNFYEGLYVDDLQILDAKTNYAWLAAQPTSGTVAPNQSSTVTLQYDATNLSGGTYKGAINIKSNDPQKSSVTLNAELEVSQDTSAPSAISDLRVTSLPNATSMNLSWTAPGDDGMTGKATSYEIRYSTSMITESNFSQGTLVSSPPTPQTAGSTETFTLSGINLLQSTYYVAIKTKDDVGNVALISNVILSSSLDSDADGLSDQDELALGTNPFNPDSDSDGYTDGQEKSIGTDPLSGTDYPAKILISGDDAYQLYANGTLIGTGSKWYIPGTHLCKLGDSIAIKVNNYGWIGGLIFQVQHGSKIKPSNFLVKVSKTAASDWKEINFDDTSWQSASEHYPYGKGPWGSVVNGFDSSAYWIGLENPFESTFYVRFKVDFTLNAKINITADNVFEAWMDGQSLGSGDSWWLPKTYIATVKTGTLFAIHGINQGGPGGLSALITYIDDNGKRRSIGTDSSWKGSLFQETNWEKKSFDDGHWAPSLELYGLGSGPWGYSGMLNQMSSTDAAHSWIWGSLDTEKNIHFYTRKTIPELPNATIYVTADNQFSLYQNGKLIGGSSEWWKTKSFGLNVNKGDVIAFKVDNFGGPGGLIASMDYNGKTIVSNTTWVVTTESMSGNNNSWTSQNYDTSSWLNASSLGENGSSPWGIRPGIDASAEWVGPSDFESNPVAYFRFKVGDANAPVGQCKIQSACDDECKMYLNGKLIASGNKWYQPQNTSISASSGDILAVEAKDHGYKAGMLFKMTGTYSLNSDTTWKCSTNAPSDWKEKDFNDTSWENATSWGVYGAAPWGQNVSGFSGGSSYWIWSKNNQTASFNIDATVYFRKKIE
ncbi:MAG: S8 family serine peptidase [Chlamydiae bacterium]|nr:S8 family serine peptidase [Chlamydiota bacterium]